MTTITLAGTPVEVDEEGFLSDPGMEVGNRFLLADQPAASFIEAPA